MEAMKEQKGVRDQKGNVKQDLMMKKMLYRKKHQCQWLCTQL